MYRLASHVHACLSDDQVVLLDLRADKYLALSHAQAAELGKLIVGWPIRDPALSPETPTQRGTAILGEMARRCLLADDLRRGKDAAPIEIPRVENKLALEAPDAAVRIQFKHVRRFALACIWAACALRWRSLRGVVESVQRRKARQEITGTSFPFLTARQLVSIHERLRLFFYSARGECLYDSLVLTQFLALHKVFPTWVIGVKTGPFSAHSWVQEGPLVFNDTPELIRKFVPILAI